MPTSVPNFNFLAPLVTEIWRGSHNKNWELLISFTFLCRALVRANVYKCAKFQLPGSISFRDKEGVLKFNVGATSPLPYPVRWKFYVCSVYLARSNSMSNFTLFQHRISMHHAVMRICISHRLSIVCAQKWRFWGFWGWRYENTVF